jgi:hypothetical protein
MTRKREDVFATCVFGSVARGDSDCSSDKDILVVSSDHERRRLASATWKMRGWSVASYTPNRLLTMARAGSLFLQHLKTEGIVLDDKGEFLRDLLQGYSPRQDYTQDLAKCLDALLLLERCEGLPVMSYWAADVLFVIFRNAAILRLANDQIYKFSFAEIAKTLYSRGVIRSNDLESLADLRIAKAAYRNRRFTEPGVWPTVDNTLRIMERVFQTSVSRTLGVGAARTVIADPYFSLRSTEKHLLEQHLTWDSHNQSAYIRQAWKMIVDPRAYSWEIRTSHHELALHIRGLSRSPASTCDLNFDNRLNFDGQSAGTIDS